MKSSVWAAVLGYALIGAATLQVRGTEPFLRPAVASSPPVVSSSQRFVFRGFNSKDALDLSAWSEKVAGKVEGFVGEALPFQRSEMIRFTARDNTALEAGQVQLGQNLMEDLLQQRIGLENPQLLEEEEVLEGFVAVLLYRYVVAEFRAVGMKGEPVVPDWFSVGVAQAIQPGLRDRNTRYVVGQWEAGNSHRVAEITGWTGLPAGRVTQKAYCGLLVEWLQTPLRERVGWSNLLRRMARGDSLHADWVRDDVLGLTDAREVEKSWDLHLALATQVNREWGAMTFEQVADLKRVLTRYTAQDGGMGYAPTTALYLDDLVLMREEEWVRQVAAGMLGDLSQFAVGQAPRIREVTENYQQFFLALQSPKSMDPMFKFTVGGPDAVLQKLLRTANESMEQLEKEVAMRTLYMNRVQSGSSSTDEATQPTTEPQQVGDSLESKRKAFLDALEAKQDW